MFGAMARLCSSLSVVAQSDIYTPDSMCDVALHVICTVKNLVDHRYLGCFH